MAFGLALIACAALTGLVAARADLPRGNEPLPVAAPQFPDRLHAFVWRNWGLVPVARMAAVVGAKPHEIVRMGRAMGLVGPPRVSADQLRRSYITLIRRNWHLLPYDQLLALLGWTEEQLAFTLREDDFLYIKLGSHKPRCERLTYAPPNAEALRREREIASIVREDFPGGVGVGPAHLFDFVRELSAEPPATAERGPQPKGLSPRFCSSYFALYGDPLLDAGAGPYPDGYLARLARSGVDGVWLQAVLYKLAPFPWDPKLSEGYGRRLAALRRLVARARKHDIRVYLYLNEPRAMPLSFFEGRQGLRGVVEGDHAALCTSAPETRRYIVDSIAAICRAVPDLGGLFTITASENLTNCWSHGGGAACPRCGKRSPAEVIAEVNGLIAEGIRRSGAHVSLIAWDWGWSDDWAPDAIARLPEAASLMSVSEWSLPIRRGGIDSVVGEYSISAIGPGPRALRHWALAKSRGLKTLAKIQAGNTWELSAVPYIPAVDRVARHAANLQGKIDGIMLGWTLGGYPSPNLEAVAEVFAEGTGDVDGALHRVAARLYGADAADGVVDAWRTAGDAFAEFPYHIGTVYVAPLQMGPANPLWEKPTGYSATMSGFPYDDVDGWRSIYPAPVFEEQLRKVAAGFEAASNRVRALAEAGGRRRELAREADVMEAAAIHFCSVANQTRFVTLRRSLDQPGDRRERVAALDAVLRDEEALAIRLHAIQCRDSRVGFESSNHYFYVPQDLAEKALVCRDLRERWLPTLMR